MGLPRFVVDVAGVVIEVPRETRYSEITSRDDVEMSWEDWEGVLE
jgi:biotin synthase-related radical SAM superfamily protein